MGAFKKFRSQKIVAAALVLSLELGQRKVTVQDLEDAEKKHVIPVPDNFFARGAPEPGDYLVRYNDGYLSWSPKQAFEEGHVELDEGDDGELVEKAGVDDAELVAREEELEARADKVAAKANAVAEQEADLAKREAELKKQQAAFDDVVKNAKSADTTKASDKK